MKSADPGLRMTLGDIAEDRWVIGDDGPIPGYVCWCQRKNLKGEVDDETNMVP